MYLLGDILWESEKRYHSFCISTFIVAKCCSTDSAHDYCFNIFNENYYYNIRQDTKTLKSCIPTAKVGAVVFTVQCYELL